MSYKTLSDLKLGTCLDKRWGDQVILLTHGVPPSSSIFNIFQRFSTTPTRNETDKIKDDVSKETNLQEANHHFSQQFLSCMLMN